MCFFPVSVALFMALMLPEGVLDTKYKLLKIVGAEKISFVDALVNLKISPDDYIYPQQVSAHKGKNIVVISVESLEKGFLEEPFIGVAPYLSKLTKEWTYYAHMPEVAGSNFTAASLYTYQVGVPAFFKGQSYDFFQGASSTKLTGLGHILNRAGYNVKYLIGTPDFAGITDILNVYDVPVFSHSNSLGKYEKLLNSHLPGIDGLNDYDLFNEARLQIDEFRKDGERPFAVFLSTVNSHGPDGIYDERMRPFVNGERSGLEFSVAATDYLIERLINYLQKNDLIDSTSVYIFPDHCLIGGRKEVEDKLSEQKRELYLITNVSESKLHRRKSEVIHQIDLPRIIIDGAEIKTNAKFLVDYLDINEIEGFIENNQSMLSSLNESALEKKKYRNGIRIFKEGDFVYVESDEDSMKFHLSSIDDAIDITFHPGMIPVHKYIVNKASSFDRLRYDNDMKYIYLVVSLLNNGSIRSYLGNKRQIGYYKEGTSINYNSGDIGEILEERGHFFNELYDSVSMLIMWSKPIFYDFYSSIKTCLYINIKELMVSSYYSWKYKDVVTKHDVNRFIAHAGGGIGGHAYTNSLEALNASYDNGFRLFELDIVKTSDDVFVAAHTWKHWADMSGYNGSLPPDLKTFKKNKVFGKFTPMDIDDINEWFQDRPDAILVTDKINEPSEFSSFFCDKKRLIMELFTWEAVVKGANSGILAVLPAFTVLKEISGHEVNSLKKYDIKYITAPRNVILNNRELVMKLVNSGINFYVYNFKFDNKNEKYTACVEREYFYGMYADNWDFSASLDCSDVAY
jgi:phosphoglycerol transferase